MLPLKLSLTIAQTAAPLPRPKQRSKSQPPPPLCAFALFERNTRRRHNPDRGNSAFKARSRKGTKRFSTETSVPSLRSPGFRLGTRAKKSICVPWVLRLVHISLTPGHPTGRMPPSPEGSLADQDLCLCALPFQDKIRADFREGDEDSNFALFRVRRSTESPGPLHWIAFSAEILTKPLIHWIASPPFNENPFFSVKSASSHPLPKNRLRQKH